jgi:hypothetical protein
MNQSVSRKLKVTDGGFHGGIMGAQKDAMVFGYLRVVHLYVCWAIE